MKMRSITTVLCALISTLLATPALLSGQQNAAPQQKQPTPQGAAGGRAPSIVLSQDGKLSVTVSHGRLAAVLSDISRRAHIEISLAESVEADFASSDFRDLPFEEGLKRLLAGYDVFYLYSGPDEKTPGAIKSAWVFRRGEGWDLQPVPPALWAGTKELEKQLEDPDPDVRSDTYETLIERQGERGLETVRKGLNDPDELVRLRTLSAAMDADVEIPARDLEPLILDAQLQSQAVRVMALRAIEGRPEAQKIVTTVSNDPDETVRTVAQQILARLRPPPL